MKESKRHIDKNVDFYEPMLSGADVVDNGGTITDVIFDNGVGTFNGTTSYISYTNIDMNKFNQSNDYSISVWFKANNVVSQVILISASTGIDDRFSITINSNTIRVGSRTGSVWTNKSIAFTDTTSWHHVVLTNSNGIVEGYLDGVALTGSLQPSGSSIYGISIGAAPVPSSFFNGDIDSVIIYDRTLSAEEVSALSKNLLYKKPSPTGRVLSIPVIGSIYDEEGNTLTITEMEVARDGSIDRTKISSGATTPNIDTGISISNKTNLTINFWGKKDKGSDILCMGSADSATTRFVFMNFDNGMVYLVLDETLNRRGITPSDLGLVGWSMYTLVFDGSGATNADKLKLYVNGQEETLNYTGTILEDTPNITDTLAINKRMLGGGTLAYDDNGKYSRILVLENSWTPEQVAREYNSTKKNYNL